jgi:hypothetical protein
MNRFNPAAQMDATPPFVLWTLVRDCALRETSEFTQPEATERLLRGVRASSDALATGRVSEGIAVAKPASNIPLGFELATVLEPWGGLAEVKQHCATCPANALARVESSPLAGCVGFLVPASLADAAFHECMNELVGEHTSTHPRWYGLWLEAELSCAMLHLHQTVFEQLALRNPAADMLGLQDYLAAVASAVQHQLSLRVQLYPPGICEGRRWTLAAHCGRCIAAWPEARRQQCRVCGQVGGRQPERTRRRMGIRPYRPLQEFLSESQIQSCLRSTCQAEE